MCQRFGSECQGLDDGPLFVDMTKKARHGMQKRNRKPTMEVQRISAIQTLPHQAYFDQISQQAVVAEAFYSRFLSYFTSDGDGKDIRNRKTWLHRLPQMSVDGSNDALTLAVQATAYSYCAVETHNPTLTRHAWDLYGQAIQIHGRFLARSRSTTKEITLHMISTSVLFSFFEAMQATSADAYRLHVYGAAKMFEVADPRACAEGVLCQIFFHIRTQLAFVQLTSNGKRTSVDVKKILYDALDYEELPIFQRVTTQFTKLADVYSDMDISLRQKEEVRFLTAKESETIRTEIESLWDEYSETASTNHEILMWHDPYTATTQFRDAFTALTIAYFSATRILLAIIATPSTTPHGALEDYCQSVLQASLYMQTCSIGCAYMRMAAPLLLVALNAPELKQRTIAISCFRSWERGSMRGISELALDTVQRRSTQRMRIVDVP
jgi:hypothetical protein